MAGGVFLGQNKVRAGVYLNFVTTRSGAAAVGERGCAAVALPLKFGPEGLSKVEAGTDVRALFGYNANAPELLLLREAAKKAQTVLVYRLAGGEKASGTGGGLTITAKWGGSRGNDITVSVKPEGDLFRVETYLDGEKAESWLVSDIAALTGSDLVEFSGEGPLSEQAGIALSGGTDEEVNAESWNGYFKALETADLETLAVPTTDTEVKQAAVAFVKRMRETEGKMIQAVVENYPQADSEGVISVKNGVLLEDGTEITAADATAFVAGMTAGAQLNESNTYAVYTGAASVTERYLNSEIEDALQNGEWLFVPGKGGVIVEQDINSFTSFTAEKGAAFSKNRLVRVMDAVANDIRSLFEGSYLGQTGNSADGRSLFKAELCGYFTELEALGAIDGFDSREDIEVLPGEAADAVVVNLRICPVDSMEKLYLTVTVE